MSKITMKGSVGIFLLLVCIVAIMGMLGYIFLVKPSGTGGNTNTPNPQLIPSPTIPVKDFAPGMPVTQKTQILIQTNDSSDEKYIVPTNQVSVYIKSLPQGDHVISQSAL